MRNSLLEERAVEAEAHAVESKERYIRESWLELAASYRKLAVRSTDALSVFEKVGTFCRRCPNSEQTLTTSLHKGLGPYSLRLIQNPTNDC